MKHSSFPSIKDTRLKNKALEKLAMKQDSTPKEEPKIIKQNPEWVQNYNSPIISKLMKEIPKKDQEITTVKMLKEALDAQDKELQSLRDQLAAKEKEKDAYSKAFTEVINEQDKELQQRDETIKRLESEKETMNQMHERMIERGDETIKELKEALSKKDEEIKQLIVDVEKAYGH